MLYSLLHLECDAISIANLNLMDHFTKKRGERNLENNEDLRLKK